MKTRLRSATIVVVIATSLWLLHRLQPVGDRHREPEVAAPASRDLPVPDVGSAQTGNVIAAAEAVAKREPSLSDPSAGQPAEWGAVEALLARPDHRPLMREVPRLSAESEARLVAVYRQTEGLWNKQHIVRILAFGGGSPAAEVLRAAVTAEFSGKHVSPGDDMILSYIPELCGVLARHNDEAFDFLLRASRPEFWSGRRLWEADIREVSVRILTGASIKGLGLSGRLEAQEVLDWYRDHPWEVGVTERNGSLDSVDGAVVDAVFKMTIVREMGIEVAMDEVFYDPEIMLRRFGEWRKTPEGTAWCNWAGGAQQAARAKAAARGTGAAR